MTLLRIEDQRQAECHQHVERTDDQPVGDVEQNDLDRHPMRIVSAQQLERDRSNEPPSRSGSTSPDHAQVGRTILHPVSATEPAASSPETSDAMVNTSSGPDFGGCTSPTKMFGINS